MTIGTRIEIIQGSFIGSLGYIAGLSIFARHVAVQLDNGVTVTVPIYWVREL